MRYSLLLLFLGYYGSITLFPHNHIINGVTIAHSHPYPANTDKYPGGHQHSSKGCVLIQLLSTFIATVLFATLALQIFHLLIRKLFILKKVSINITHPHSYIYSLRGPPLN